MITVSKIANAGAAMAYYAEKDEYYREGGSAPAEFFGRGAKQLGLAGALETRRNAERFADVLAGTATGKMENHTAGYDVTFSAPKSVSVAALVNCDDRLVAAHDAAVKAALAHIERHAIVTRQRGADGVGYEWRHGDGMVAAVFRHTTSREQDAQLHTHAVIANTTRDPQTGEWRAIDSREIYRIQREAGAVYTTELAAAGRALGYAVDWGINRDGHPQMELAAIPQQVRDHFSTRSAQVEAALAARGLTRESASNQAKQAAALDTRASKEVVDHAELAARWRDEARAMGWDANYAPAPPRWPDAESQKRSAEAAVLQAAEHLGERDARFSSRSLEHEASLFCQGRATGEQIRAAIRDLTERGALEHREVLVRAAGGRREHSAGFTTRAGIEIETRLLLAAQRLTDRHANIGPPHATQGHRQLEAAIAVRAQEGKTGHEFTPEQRAATTAILTTGKALHILGGHAGTAKTSSVLAAVRGAAVEQGFKVRALAPTNAAAEKLGNSIGERGATLASHIMERSSPGMRAPHEREIWIVDEGGMVGARDMQRLLEKAAREAAVVILAGDTRQLGSVEAGQAFEQLTDRFGSVNLTDIKRQQNPELRAAVYDAVRGDARAALDRVPVQELKTREQRVDAITSLYMSRPVEQRRETLVLAPGTDDRQQINTAIRDARRAAGELGRETTVISLVKSDMTRAEQRDAARYQPGMVIEAGRRFQMGPDKGERVEVIGVEKGKVITRMADGRKWRFDPRKVTSVSVYDEARKLRVAEGDKLIARGAIASETANGATPVRIGNGTQLDVIRVRDDVFLVRDRDGRELAIGHTAQVDYGYAQTVHQSQGQDFAHVIAHAESARENLSSMASMYVTISRARESAIVVTDSRSALAATLEANSGRKSTALEAEPAPYALGHLAEHQSEQQPAPELAPPDVTAPPAPNRLDQTDAQPMPDTTPEPVAEQRGHAPEHDGPELG